MNATDARRVRDTNGALVHQLPTICSKIIQKALELSLIECAALFRSVEGVDDGVGFVAVLPEKTPRHTLLSTPCHARGAESGVAGDIHVMSAPASG